MDHRNLYDVIVHIAHSRSTTVPAVSAVTRARADAKQNDRIDALSRADDGRPEPTVDGDPSRWRRDLRWGTPEFDAASDLARRMAEGRRLTTLIKALPRGPQRRALLATHRAPIAIAHLRASDDRLLRSFVPPAGRTVFSGTRAQAVLDVPMSPYEYLSGKRRQAVRTNIRQAARAGIICERSAGYLDWMDSAEDVLAARDSGAEALATMGPPPNGARTLLYAAKDAEGMPVAVAGAVLFGDLAYLFTLLSDPDHKTAAASRYMLHTFVALDLGQEGARHLVVGSALREREGNQYFQHLLGYRVRNLRLDVTP
ncbi:MAG: hypothetical protein QOG65_3654 [Actinomycetota bacterium]|nr:hypothetical protein [Actinomycetota bacterium]